MRILLKYNVDTSIQEKLNGETALYKAVNNQYLEIVSRLLNHGADITIKSDVNIFFTFVSSILKYSLA